MKYGIKLSLFVAALVSCSLLGVACGGQAPVEEESANIDQPDQGSAPAWSPSILRFPNYALTITPINPFTWVPCSATSVRLTVINNGDLSAPATVVGVYRDATMLSQTSVPPLAVGATFTTTLPYHHSPGTITYAMVDRGNAVIETNENDNTKHLCGGP